tara:strand:+ start:192 stop:590 length:399 start_codon:yes stop_codon:yes gene_type:complete
MRIVYITTEKQYTPIRGRVFEAFCEHDPDLLEAHRIVREMSELTGLQISEFKYCISEERTRVGAILSYSVNDLSDMRAEDTRLQSIGASLLFSDKDKPVEWHQFYEIDVDAYERAVSESDESFYEFLKEDIF